MQDIAGILRRFAQIEADSVETLLRAADATLDPQAAERRRRVAREAEKKGRLATQRANRVEQQLLSSAVSPAPPTMGGK